MLRDRNLIPLSHQHQHALALCVRITRAVESGSADLDAFQAEMATIMRDEIDYHFRAEEKILFPAAERFPSLLELVKHLRSEHGTLRGFFARAEMRKLDGRALKAFAETLSQHIRREERELFEGSQQVMSAEELERLGNAIDEFFRSSGMPGASCALRPVAQ
ncbi:MAG: hemerythrin domain-containing protein [Acidobacteriaceae bacterium]|nr:hemerythrin domain-containing protein [Acidobacteriaceae bacterium]